ncbi:MAG TPA: DMT family transporter [Candidatus Norongarragalinales archaeon]|nr:DMT family transporter [Candidatus Norongarragalinales archaeon]
MSEEKGIVLAFLTALISGASVFVNGFVVKGFDPVVFTALKNLGAAIFLVGAIILLKERKKLSQLSSSQWKWLIAIGIIGGSIPFLMFFQGLSMIPAVKGSFLFRMLFIFSAVFAIFMLKEKPSRNTVIGAMIFLVGNAILIGQENIFSFGLGELLVLLATIIWAFEYVLSKWVMQKTGLEPRMVAFGRMFVGMLVLAGYLGAVGKISSIPSLSLIQWEWVAITSVFLFLFVSSWYAALKWAKAATATAILAMGGPITTALNFLFLGKAPLMIDALGLLLVVAGISILVGLPQMRSSASFAVNELKKLSAWKA